MGGYKIRWIHRWDSRSQVTFRKSSLALVAGPYAKSDGQEALCCEYDMLYNVCTIYKYIVYIIGDYCKILEEYICIYIYKYHLFLI